MTDFLCFRGGRILADDFASSRLGCVEVGTDGRIRTVCFDEASKKEQRGNPVDLAGGVLIPGFNDAHIHIWKVGHLLTSMLDVRGVSSIEELGFRIRDFAGNNRHRPWIQARGYNEALLAEGRHPNRHDLDAVCPDRPVYLIRTCAHIAVANSRALELAEIGAGTPAPSGGVIERDDSGEPTGVLHETAIGLVAHRIPRPTRDDYERMILAAQDHLLRLGITSATDPAVTPDLIDAYRHLDETGRLRMRVNLLSIRRPDGGMETLPLPEKYMSPHLRLDSIKFFADGGLSGATAAVGEPYRHDGSHGVLRFSGEELFDLALPAHRAGLRIGTHAIGDRAIELVLRVYERLYAVTPGLRHRIEHCGLPTDDQLRRIARAGIVLVPQATFLRELGANFRRYLADDYSGRIYPLRWFLDHGIDVALSSDAPVVRNFDPLGAMRAAVSRRGDDGITISPTQGITTAEALRAYTLGGALASGDVERAGSIQPCKYADFALLDRCPLEIDPASLEEIRVIAVYVAGREVHRA